MGKPQSGLELGNTAWLGSYSLCKNLTAAQYCLASIKINIPMLNQVSFIYRAPNCAFICPLILKLQNKENYIIVTPAYSLYNDYIRTYI